jgi:Uma2 family endonuclease
MQCGTIESDLRKLAAAVQGSEPMASLILDEYLEDEIKRRRAQTGADRYDEVWDGVYVMSPIANNEHQYLALYLAMAIGRGIRTPDDGIVFQGCNVSDQEEDWTRNYRVPDVAVFLKDNPAEDRKTHWFGGPDFAIEIISPGDRSRDKFEFYFDVGVREVLIVDRKPWKLELYRNDGKKLALVGTCTPAKSKTLDCMVIPFRFSLAAGKPRPKVIVVCRTDGRSTRI